MGGKLFQGIQALGKSIQCSRQLGLFTAESPLISTLLLVICIHKINSCVRRIGWLYICFTREWCNMSSRLKIYQGGGNLFKEKEKKECGHFMHHEQDLRKVDLQMLLSRLQWFVENCRALLNVRLEKRGVKLHLELLWWLSSWSGWFGQRRSEVRIPLAMYSEHEHYLSTNLTKEKTPLNEKEAHLHKTCSCI